MRVWPFVLFVNVGALGGCRRARQATPPPSIPATAPQVIAPSTQEVRVDPDELLPGTSQAFGLPLPVNTAVRFEDSETRMYHVNAQMPRVMRYLQQRLEFATADIQPLGALIRHARLRDTDAATVVDVGVRDEGDRTLVTVWNRTPIPQAQPRTMEDALRAAGIDPQTHQVDPRYNR